MGIISHLVPFLDCQVLELNQNKHEKIYKYKVLQNMKNLFFFSDITDAFNIQYCERTIITGVQFILQ